MLKHRLIFGTLMVSALLGLFYLDNALDRLSIAGTFLADWTGRTSLPAGLLMLGLMLVLVILGAREISRIFRAKGLVADSIMATLAGWAGCILLYAVPQSVSSQSALAIFASIVVALFLGSLVRHSWRRETQGAVAAGAFAMFSLIYLGLLPGFLIAIRRWHNAWVIVAIIMITKSCDIGAYFTGRAIGRHKLIPWLSPGKTWEGLMGGVLLSGVVAAGLAALSNHYDIASHWRTIHGVRTLVPHEFHVWGCFAAGILMGLVGQFGDLTASLFKRDAGIKDSGSSIPGFGGVIDVADSPIVVAPLAYWLLLLSEG